MPDVSDAPPAGRSRAGCCGRRGALRARGRARGRARLHSLSAVWVTIARNGAGRPQLIRRRAAALDLLVGEERVVGRHVGAVERQPLDQRQGPGVGEFLDAFPIGQAEDQDGHVVQAAEQRLERLDGGADLGVVGAARDGHDLEVGGAAQQQVRVDGDAVTADADAGLVDVRVRLAVGAVDDFLDVDAHAVGVAGEVVGQGDVDVAVGRVGDLAELGGLGAAHGHDLGVEHGVVEVGGAPPGLRARCRRPAWGRSPGWRTRRPRRAARARRRRRSPGRPAGPWPPRAAARTGRACRRPGEWSRR